MNRTNYLVLHFVCLEKKGECDFSNFSPIPTGYLFISLWAWYFKLFVLFWKPISLLWLKSNGSQFENEKKFILNIDNKLKNLIECIN